MKACQLQTLRGFRLASFAALFLLPQVFLIAQDKSPESTYGLFGVQSSNLLAKTSFPYSGNDEVIALPVRSGVSSASTETFSVEPLRSIHSNTVTPAILVSTPRIAEGLNSHSFWDRKNRLLFAMNASFATADFFTTRRNLNSHGKELNPMTRMFTVSTAALATNFALETGGEIGISYLFHKTGHHKLERLTSCFNSAASAFAVTYNLTHR